MDIFTLAVDIEKVGARLGGDIVAIGAVLMDRDFQVYKKFFEKCFFDESQVDNDTVDFYEKNKKMFNSFKYNGILNRDERVSEVINKFQDFRRECEEFAKTFDYKLEFVTDNNVFDGGHLNYLIERYTKDLPIPYSASRDENGNQMYSTFFETHSELRGVLAMACPKFKEDWRYSDKIKEVFDLPEFKIEHDHNPLNDAKTIAYDHIVFLGIRDGIYKLKKKGYMEQIQSYFSFL